MNQNRLFSAPLANVCVAAGLVLALHAAPSHAQPGLTDAGEQAQSQPAERAGERDVVVQGAADESATDDRTTTATAHASTAPSSAEESFFSTLDHRHSTQVGMDWWKLAANTSAPTGIRRLFLANSTPQWNYHRTAPWYTHESQLQLRSDIQLSLRARASQSSGFRLDGLSADWAISPSLGLRAGVLDYKTSWCRSYDIDSPWARENDPFCTVRTTDLATGAAPGLQAYLITQWGGYNLQGAFGLFRPMAFNYDRTEFTNAVLQPGSYVNYNHKLALSLNAVNVQTGTEFRLSYQDTDQEATISQPRPSSPYQQRQKAGLFYLAGSWYASKSVNLRVTHLKSDLDYTCIRAVTLTCLGNVWKSSNTFEITYDAAPVDKFVIGYSLYKLVSGFGSSGTGFVLANDLNFRHKAVSLAWRRDWAKGFYSVVQFSKSNVWQQAGNFRPNEAKGHGLGLRIAYRF